MNTHSTKASKVKRSKVRFYIIFSLLLFSQPADAFFFTFAQALDKAEKLDVKREQSQGECRSAALTDCCFQPLSPP